MISFKAPGMTCGHCVSTITKAVKALDNTAHVQIDLASHRLDIVSAHADAAALSAAIQRAEFTPIAVAAGPARTGVVPARKGCCCG